MNVDKFWRNMKNHSSILLFAPITVKLPTFTLFSKHIKEITNKKYQNVSSVIQKKISGSKIKKKLSRIQFA